MRLLLDTHILLWWLSGSARLPRRSRERLVDPGNTLFISAASLWEIRIKESLGRIQVPADLERQLGPLGMEALAISTAHTAALADLPLLHRDPFDRMLLAQASVEGMKLLTSDRAVLAYGPPSLAA